MNIDNIIDGLIILGLANGAPILAARIFGDGFSLPIDAGCVAADGRRILGDSKTWRGIVSAFLLALPVAVWLDWSPLMAFTAIALSMLGDLCSSFIKRRRGLVSSSRAIGLDQIPETGLPVVYLYSMKAITVSEGLVIVMVFIVVEVVLSKVLFKLHIRKRPY